MHIIIARGNIAVIANDEHRVEVHWVHEGETTGLLSYNIEGRDNQRDFAKKIYAAYEANREFHPDEVFAPELYSTTALD